MKTGKVYHWDSVSDMPEAMHNKAMAAGMWDCDIDSIVFIKRGSKVPEAITKAKQPFIPFPIDDGVVFVSYHS